ncbi:MAG: DUF58 domain-containing protein [Neomegalonema sp.]
MAEVAANPVTLRRDAEALSATLPPLLAQAERLASTVVLGAHGRRRAGMGETFWQYRPATPGDAASSIDWRRSARSDQLYVRQTEWEAAQTVWLWCDRCASMSYKSRAAQTDKRDRAAVLATALASLLSRGGERLAALGTDAARPAIGESQMTRIAAAFSEPEDDDFGAPPAFEAVRGGRAVFVSDFFGDEQAILAGVNAAASQGVDGLLLQVVDPAEETFPFDGRIVFESMRGLLNYETDRAKALREDYIKALSARRDRLADAARRAGWRFSVHRTSDAPTPALLWLSQGISQPRNG